MNIEEGKRGFSIDHKEDKFTRTVDVVFFSHGAIHPEDKRKVYPTLMHDETRLFEVPRDTRVFEYYNPEEEEDFALRPKADQESAQQRLRNDLIKKISLRQDLIRGTTVNPQCVCNPTEPCLDRPDFFHQFNSASMGARISTMKITITQDVVDSGTRKIVEDIQVKKYSDYEVFSFGDVIK